MGAINDGHLRMMNERHDQHARGVRRRGGRQRRHEQLPQGPLRPDHQEPHGRDGNPLPDDSSSSPSRTSRDRTLQSGKLLLSTSTAARRLSHVHRPHAARSRAIACRARRRRPLTTTPRSSATRTTASSSRRGPTAPSSRELLDDGEVARELRHLPLRRQHGQRIPIYDDPTYWDVLARPVKARAEPPVTASALAAGTTATTIGAHQRLRLVGPHDPGGRRSRRSASSRASRAKRAIDMFGTTEFDGQSLYAEIPLQTRQLVRGVGARQRALPHPAHRQVRHERRQRVDLDQRPRR